MVHTLPNLGGGGWGNHVADRGNKRIQVFDSDGNYKTTITGMGIPRTVCITPGPHQYLYRSNSNEVNTIDEAGEIYKMELDGTILGKVGKAGRMIKEFGTVNVVEMITWRVQKLSLHPQK